MVKNKFLVFLASAAVGITLGAGAAGSGNKSAGKHMNTATATATGKTAAQRPTVRVKRSRGTNLERAVAQKQTKRSVRGAPVFVREKIDGEHLYIIQLNEPAVARYRGGISGFAATSPEYLARNGGTSRKLNVRSPATIAYANYLRSRQSEFHRSMEGDLGRAIKMDRQYEYALNGFTVTMTQDEAARVAGLPGIKRITRNVMQSLLTDAGPAFIGAPAIWNGDAADSGIGTQGEGMIAGIMDSGINGDHPSFAAAGSDGYEISNPLGEGVYLGECFSRPDLVCNSKLIGRWDLTGSGDSEDVNGHGTHVASTVAGNYLEGITISDAEGNPTNYTLGAMSGVAPRASIVAYRVCPGSSCSPAAIIAAVNQAIVDGVDTLNHSISSSGGSPWEDATAQAFKAARAAGISLSNSAGNSGTEPGVVSQVGNSPWTTSIAASTHDRAFPTKNISFSGAGAPPTVSGQSITEGLTATIVYAGDYANPNDPAGDPAQCLQPFPAGTFNGEIVLCDRGAIARVDKAIHVRDGGAGGFVLCNVDGGAAFLADDVHVIPGIQITAEDCNPVRDWLQSGSGHVATIDASEPPVRDPAAGDIMATFSSRGPYLGQEYLAPHVSAPGVSIFAAYADPIDYAFLQGTSMSNPHVSGSMVLLKAAHPDWTDAEVTSALMLTANADMRRDVDPTVFLGPLEPADNFDFGAGRVRLELATRAGLVLDETDDNFSAANPAIGGDARTLNLASLYTTECLGNCSWTRTFRATRSGTWTLAADVVNGVGVSMSPSSFTVNEGDLQEVTFTADVNDLESDLWFFSNATLVEASDASPNTVLPLVVQTAAAIFPSKLSLTADRDAGSMLSGGVRTAAIDGLTVSAFGLTQPESRMLQISGSVGDFTPYTGQSTQIEFYNVPAGSVQMIAETVASTAPDVDLFVGQDLNLDREISPDEELCQSGNADSFESCTLTAEQLASGGVFWVAVFNYAGSGDDIVDETELEVAIVSPAFDDSISASVPSSVVGGEPFDVRVWWNLPMEVGQTYIGAVELLAPDGSLGLIPVEITRIEDDVKLLSSQTAANVGDTLSMTVEVSANLTPEDRFYVVSTPIPAGTELVPGSVRGGGQSFVINNQVIWTVDQPSLTRIGRTYQPSINGPNVDPADPLYNAACDTGFGGYVDLDAFGYDLDPSISGNNVSYSAFGEQSIYFYGGEMANGLSLTDDGFLLFGSLPGDNPGNNTGIPNGAAPNAMAAVLWNDMEIVADATSGVTLATGGDFLSVVEFDDMQRAPAGSSSDRIDFVALVSGRLNDIPNQFELIYAYNNIVGDWSGATIGVENSSGTAGTSYNGALSDGLMICWDYLEQPTDPANLSFDVKVLPSASGSIIEATAFSVVDMPGSVEVMETLQVDVATSDSDNDGISDELDNCAFTANAEQVDADADGFGNMCDGDFNQDMVINFLDVVMLIGSFGTGDPTVDINTDGVVDHGDIEMFKTMWLRAPGPSGLR